MALIKDQIKEIEKLYRQYLGKKTLQEYLTESRKNNVGDEETITDPLFRDMLQNPVLWGYGGDNVLLQQQKHKIIWEGNKQLAKPDFETNNEFCKTPILFDSKSSSIPYQDMVSGSKTVYETTYKRYLLAIKPNYKYIIGFNLSHVFLYSRLNNNDIEVKISVDLQKFLKEDESESKKFQELLEETSYEQISNEDKILKLKNKVFEDTPFNTELFFEKYVNTRDKLQRFFKERLEKLNKTSESCDEYIIADLPSSDNDNEFREQLSNRLTMIEFFKYIFIRTYEDFGLIHFSEEDKKIIPVSYGKVINNLEISTSKNTLFDSFEINFFEDYINQISKQGITDIGKEFFDGFSTLFKRYEGFIDDLIVDEKYNYYKILFDIIFFLNEFNFRELGDDIIGGLYEKTLDREDRKKFGQFYTPRYIIDFILDTLSIEPNANIKIADISCGTGGFLVKYLSRIKGDIILNDEKLSDIFKGTYGVDIKSFSVLLTKLNIALMFILKNKALKEYKEESKKIRLNSIIQGDGLGIQTKLPFKDGDFDFVVGNPPYVGVKDNADIFIPIKEDPFFSEMFVDRSDLYFYFIIEGIKRIKKGGKLGYIIPREWITSDSGYKLRKYILDNCRILGLIDFNGISIFEDAGTTSCLLFLERTDEHKENTFSLIQFQDYCGKNLVKYLDENKDKLYKKSSSQYGEAKQKIDSGYEIFSNKIFKYATFKKILSSIEKGERYDISFLGGITSGKVFMNDFITINKISQNNLSDKVWLLGDQLGSNDSLTDLKNILNSAQGIVTGCDKVSKKHYEKKLIDKELVGRGIFSLSENIDIRGVGLSDLVNGNKVIGKIELNIDGKWIEIMNEEKILIKPLYYGSDLGLRSLKNNGSFLIYLYFDDLKQYKGNKYDEEIIHEKYPNIYNYCYQFENILKSRKGANFKSYFKRGNYLSFSNPMPFVPFNKEKICFTTKGNYKFSYIENDCYSTGGGQGGVNYLFIDGTNEYTKIIDEYSNRKDFLKFINIIFNSPYIKDFLISNNFNTLSLDKIRNIIPFPRIDFNDEKIRGIYDELLDIANKFISLEKNHDAIFLKRRGSDELLNINSKEFINMLQNDIELKESTIGIEISSGSIEYIIMGLNTEEFLDRYNKGFRNLGKLLGINVIDQKEKVEIFNKLNDRVNILVKELYGD